MINSRFEFQTKRDEIALYAEHLLEANRLEKILKSTGYLLAYNVIESICFSLISDINDAINRDQLHLQQVSQQIRSLYIEYSFPGKGNTNIKGIATFADEAIAKKSIHIDSQQLVQRLKLFSGDLDHRKIVTIFKRYGISNISNIHANDVLKAKNARNKLAHGEISYSDFCKNEVARETLDSINNTLSYIDRLISVIENYVSREIYKAQTPIAT